MKGLATVYNIVLSVCKNMPLPVVNFLLRRLKEIDFAEMSFGSRTVIAVVYCTIKNCRTYLVCMVTDGTE